MFSIRLIHGTEKKLAKFNLNLLKRCTKTFGLQINNVLKIFNFSKISEKIEILIIPN